MSGTQTEALERLIRMANQIAQAFRLEPREEAVAGVADHIKSFWTPKMRRDLAAHLSESESNIDPIAMAAMERLSAN